jgi:hypothetical protein
MRLFDGHAFQLLRNLGNARVEDRLTPSMLDRVFLGQHNQRLRAAVAWHVYQGRCLINK